MIASLDRRLSRGAAVHKTPARPRVSVIIPTYNRADLVGQAIQSVLDQSLGDFEVLVIDDGSSDHTDELVSSIADARLVYIKQ